MEHSRKPGVSPETALASDIFDKFCAATTLKAILGYHRHLCELLHIKPTNFPQFYPKLKSKLKSWKAQALWAKFDKKASHKCYNRGKACPNTRVLIIGAGPCGLRAAIEAQLLGAKVVVVEKRDKISRNNVLHLWPFVIQDLRALGAKKFFGRFCAGSIDHISIRQLQCILLKVALILGVEIHEGIGFESLLPPPDDQSEERIGWRAAISPPEHPVSQYEFDVLIGADGKRNTLEGFGRKEFRGKLAIAITANFINKRTRAEARVAEISGVAFIFNQKFFKDLYAETGIDLENIVYYKDDTHYFVMTAKKTSLINKGVILNDYSDTAKLLAPENVDKNALMEYAKEAADFSTNYKLPSLEFAVNHFGQPDVAMFDFTSMYAAVNASRVVEKKGHKLFMTLVGDSLLEPFWPTGSGCARGFLSSMDACWAVRNWGSGQMNPLEVLAERESIYRILGQTTPENLNRDFSSYTLDPHTRYPNLNTRAVLPVQVKNLYSTDEPANVETCLKAPSNSSHLEQPKKRRRKDSQVHPDTLLQWLKRQVVLLNDIHITDFTSSFKDGRALCGIIHRYRPDLIDFHSLRPQDVAKNNQLAFDILERELGIPPVMTGREMEECDVPDKLTMLSYLSQVYDLFRGEIPHIKHPKLEELNVSTREELTTSRFKSDTSVKASHVSLLAHLTNQQSPRSRPPETLKLPQKMHITSPTTNDTNNTAQRRRKRRSGVVPGTVATRIQCFEAIQDVNNNPQAKNRANSAPNVEALKSRKRGSLEALKSRKRHSLGAVKSRRFSNCNKSLDTFVVSRKRTAVPRRSFGEMQTSKKRRTDEDRDPHFVSGAKKGAVVEDFDGRIKNIEAKLKGVSPATDKKPKDLLRAIGKIEKTDWNFKEIEKKIEESKWGKASKQQRVEKVPKWSRQQFVDKFSAVERKLLRKSKDDENAKKYAEIDLSLKKLTQKIKDGSTLEQGERGANKVSAMAAQLTKAVEPEKSVLQKSNSKSSLVVPAGSASELCHFCNKRVYLMERLSAEGRFFHRGCFRCEYCSITLRLGNYAFDRDGKFGNRFFCPQHFGMSGTQQKRAYRRKSEELRNLANKENILKSSNQPKTPEVAKLERDTLDRGGTPERIEFENLDPDAEEDGEAIPSEMDEDEWTDRNFGASTGDGEIGSSEELSDLSESEDDSEDDDQEGFAEALDVPLTADETRRLAEDWTRRYSNHKSGKSPGTTAKEEDGEDSESAHESDDSQGRYSTQEYDSEVQNRLTTAEKCRMQNDESETATEGEEELKARELRKQEVRVDIVERKGRAESESDTEVTTGDYTTDSSESESEEEQNSATEISTDSEFERDETTPTRHEIPDIIIGENVQVKEMKLSELSRPKLVNGNAVDKPIILHLNQSPMARPTPLGNFRRENYLLQKTASTEGIASKTSLELKKKYLLGSTDPSNAVRKSGSASSLDSRFKNFVDHISEQQKLLNPAPEPSPSMQAFLQGSEKLSVSPVGSPSLRTLKEPPTLADAKSYKHVCSLSNFITSSPIISDTNVTAKNELNERLSAAESDDSLNKAAQLIVANNPSVVCAINSVDIKETDEMVPKLESPIGEAIPDIHRSEPAIVDENMDSDSLFSDTSCSEEKAKDDSIHKFRKVEIHDSGSEQMPDSPKPKKSESEFKFQEPKLEEPNLIKESSMQNKVNVSIPDVCLHTVTLPPTPLTLAKPSEDLGKLSEVSRSTENLDVATNFSKIITVPSKTASSQVLKQVSNTSQLFSTEVGGSKDNISGRSSPASPVSACDESTAAALTETEFSDWARDEDVAVSDNIDDIEFRINPKNITFRRNQKARNKKHARGVAALIARTEEFDDDFSHVCGKVEVPVSQILSNIDNIEFMDTGEEESSLSDDRLKRNSGYVEFVNQTDDEDATTPVAVNPYVMLVESETNAQTPLREEVVEDDKSHRTETGTTTSEMTTVKQLSNEEKSLTDSTSLSSDIKSTFDSQDTSNKTYEEYVQRLQGKIFPFSNVRDSIDIRKSRRHKPQFKEPQPVLPKSVNARPATITPVTIPDSNSTPSNSSSTPSSNSNTCSSPATKEFNSFNNLPIKSPSTSRKLEEISRERLKQKDLIHEMVMNKLIAEGKSPQERKARKSNRNSMSPSVGSTTSIENRETVSDLPIVSSPKRPDSLVITANVMRRHDDVRRHSVHQDKLTAFPAVTTPVEAKTVSAMNPLRRLNLRQQSMSSFRSPMSPKTKLPETPLTNPEAFSCPDIRKALFESGDTPLKGPMTTPRFNHEMLLRTAEQVRESARARVRLMSDSQLGLSPEEKLNALRQKFAARKMAQSESKGSLAARTLFTDEPKSNPTSINYDFLENDNKVMDGKDLKHRKDRERRKSIIQAVSDFFHKKSPSPSPSKTSEKVPNQSISNKFMKLRLHTLSREKSKDKFSPPSELERSKSVSESEMRRRLIDGLAPPVPPLPLNYSLQPLNTTNRPSEESLSELDETTHCDENDISVSKKQSRLNRKLARQAHLKNLKRLRMAHEIQRQLEELEVKQRELEARGVEVEKMLRGEKCDAVMKEEPELLKEWFELMREGSELRRYEKELMVQAQEMELEDRHARLQQELRDSMAKDEASKTEEDVAKEGRILREMLEIVERRDSLIALMEADRQRYKEEDKDFEAQMLAKGLQLTSLKKREVYL
nr:PREDICTED: protein-methionine sulfoxide oxidase Mical isoform X3 [Bemisia tabaci]